MELLNNSIFIFFNIRFDFNKIIRKLCIGLGKFIICSKKRDK